MICLGGFGRLDSRAALIAGLGFALPMSCSLRRPMAQERPLLLAQNDKAEKLDALKQRDEELKSARDEQRKSAEAEAALKREIEQIGADRRKLNQDLIDTAAPLARRRIQDRGNTRTAQAAGRQRTQHPQIARWPPRGDRRSPGRACNASAAVRRRRSSRARKMRCSRCARPWCSARCCRRCGMKSKRSPTTFPSCSRCAKKSTPNATS